MSPLHKRARMQSGEIYRLPIVSPDFIRVTTLSALQRCIAVQALSQY